MKNIHWTIDPFTGLLDPEWWGHYTVSKHWTTDTSDGVQCSVREERSCVLQNTQEPKCSSKIWQSNNAGINRSRKVQFNGAKCTPVGNIAT